MSPIIKTEFPEQGVHIDPRATHSYQFILQANEAWKVLGVMDDNKRQQYSMKFWVSYTPGGYSIPRGSNLGVISLATTGFIIYVADSATDVSSLGSPGLHIFEQNSQTIKILAEKGNMIMHQMGPWIIKEDPGTLYYNIKNYEGTVNKYKILTAKILPA